MRITEVISDSNIGGAGILVLSIAKALADDFEMEIVLPRGAMLKERIDCPKIKITELRHYADKSISPLSMQSFARYFKKAQPNIVHTHASFTARLSARVTTDAALISTRHCTSGALRQMPFAKKTLYGLCTDVTVSTADCALEELVFEGVPRDRIVTIKNGSEKSPAVPPNEIASLKKQLGIPTFSRVVGCVARLEVIKGQDILIKCAARLLKRYRDLYFLFVGDGGCREYYRTLAKELGIEGRVIFTGYSPHPHRYRALFYINVQPSRGTETSSLAISESMAVGIPTVASDFGGNREMIRNGTDGILFQAESTDGLFDGISLLLSDADLYRRISIGAKKRYEDEFSISRMADAYRKLYHEAPYFARMRRRAR